MCKSLQANIPTYTYPCLPLQINWPWFFPNWRISWLSFGLPFLIALWKCRASGVIPFIIMLSAIFTSSSTFFSRDCFRYFACRCSDYSSFHLRRCQWWLTSSFLERFLEASASGDVCLHSFRVRLYISGCEWQASVTPHANASRNIADLVRDSIFFIGRESMFLSWIMSKLWFLLDWAKIVLIFPGQHHTLLIAIQ